MTFTRRHFLAASAAVSLPPLPAPAADPKPKRLVLIAGTPSHPAGFHEFNAGVRLLEQCLKPFPGLDVTAVLNGYPADDAVLDTADGILVFADGGDRHPLVRERRLDRIGKLMAKGVGLMLMHYGVEVPKDLGANELRAWVGGCYEHQFSCNPIWKPEFTAFPDHPVTRGVKPFSVSDEWYFNMRFRDGLAGVTPLLSAVPSEAVRNGPYVYPKGPYPHIQAAKGRAEHVMWAVERADGGRGVGFTGGHVHRNWLDDNFRKVVLNALVWVCRADVPPGGVPSAVTEAQIRENLDPKPAKK